MAYLQIKIRNVCVFFLFVMLLGIIPLYATSGNNGLKNPGPADDSILEKQWDSLLIQLNLDYLNGVNNHSTPFELIPIIEEILVLDPAQYNHWFNLGIENIKIHEYYEAIEALNRGIDLYPTENNHTLVQIYISLSFCYNKTGKHQLEKKILDIASRIDPEHPGVIGRYAIYSHSRLQYGKAEYYNQQLIQVLRSQGINESDIDFYLGRLYVNTDYLEAEKHFRRAYQYDQDNINKLGALAWVLICNALKIDEGMKLIEQAVAADPDNAIYLNWQGYGFYRKGNYEDALFNLYKARGLNQEYSFELDNHIKLVEDAIAQLEK
jgi:tetratricopeptide (TPR) repeat protein